MPGRAVPGLARSPFAPRGPDHLVWPTGYGLPRTIAQHWPVTLDGPPILIVTIDTEEEFDWGRPFDRAATGVRHVAKLDALQAVFEATGAVPCYLVDYPIAATPESAAVFRRYADRGAAQIGAHLHPWVTPPYVEKVDARNSYAGNLPRELELAKIESLTAAIEEGIGVRPTCFRAGRYGLGPHTFEALERLGYRVDSSLAPGFSQAPDGGPDFLSAGNGVFWTRGTGGLLEVPVTGALVGWWPGDKTLLKRAVQGAGARRLAESVLSRSGAMRQMRLSPEGLDVRGMADLTRALLRRGQRLFVLSMHSSSVVPGNTPYVRSQADADELLERIRRYVRHFTRELGGELSTFGELHARALRDRTGGVSRNPSASGTPDAASAVAAAAATALPSISVVLPAYNGEAFIERALRSVVVQAYEPIEVIVVDDGSTDRSAALAEAFPDLRVRVIRLGENRGKVAALHAGIDAASHEWIAFLDADDEWLPGKLHAQAQAILAYPDLVFSTTGGHTVLSDGRIGSTFVDGVPYNGTEFFKSQLERNYCATPAVVVSRRALRAVGGFLEPPPCEDIDLWARLSLMGRVEFVPGDYVRIHDTPGSLSKRFGAAGPLRALQVMEGHVRAAGNRLTRTERRRILAGRRAQTGRNLYNLGEHGKGAALIVRAALSGYRPAHNLAYLVTAHPGLGPVKRAFKRLAGR